jgi:hypothetical protein
LIDALEPTKGVTLGEGFEGHGNTEIVNRALGEELVPKN